MVLLSKPRAVFFDWDGTITDSWGVIYDCLCRSFKHFGQTFDLSEKEVSAFSAPAIEICRHKFGDRCHEVRDFYVKLVEQRIDEMQVLDGARKSLDMLRMLAVRMAVVSNKKNNILRQEVQKIEMGQYFDCVIGSGDAAADKPDIAMLELASQKMDLGTSYSNTWFIGDSMSDMQCAHTAGCIPILIGSAALEGIMKSEYRPAAYVRDHMELQGLIQQVFGVCAN